MRVDYLFVLLFGLLCHHVTCDDEALRECANIHHISIQVIPNVNATFTNHKCLLTCLVHNKTLASDPINEGFACPLDSSGICKNGHCIGGLEESLGECGKLHSMDFHLIRNSGTQYTNSLCQLKCMIDGNVIGLHGLNDGLQCPKDFNGVCRNGQCVTASETMPTTTRNTAPTSVPTTVATTSPTTAPTTAPTFANPSSQIEVTLTHAQSLDSSRKIFQVQICYQNKYTASFNWRSCGISLLNHWWTSEHIDRESTKRSKCFTIKEHTPDSYLGIGILHKSNLLYDAWHNNFEEQILEKTFLQWSKTFYDLNFNLTIEFQKLH